MLMNLKYTHILDGYGDSWLYCKGDQIVDMCLYMKDVVKEYTPSKRR